MHIIIYNKEMKGFGLNIFLSVNKLLFVFHVLRFMAIKYNFSFFFHFLQHLTGLNHSLAFFYRFLCWMVVGASASQTFD